MDPMQFNPMIQHSATHMACRFIIDNEERTQLPSDRAADTQARANPPAVWNATVWLLVRMAILRLQRSLNGG
jgi:hypothetical protein